MENTSGSKLLLVAAESSVVSSARSRTGTKRISSLEETEGVVVGSRTGGRPTTETEALKEFNLLLHRVINQVISNRSYQPFKEQVMLEEYLRVIRDPMWLTRMKDKCKKHEYTSLQSFTDDIDLIVSNCKRFNSSGTASSWLTKVAERLKEDMVYGLTKIREKLHFFKVRLPNPN